MQIARGWDAVQFGVVVKEEIFRNLKLALGVNTQQWRRPIESSM